MKLGTILTAKDALNALSSACHEANKNWWLDLNRNCSMCGGAGVLYMASNLIEDSVPTTCSDCNGTGHPTKQRNVGELLMLCVSELAEAMEGHRKDLMDDKLPHRKMMEVELADCLIRIFDLCAGLRMDIGGAFEEKMKYNAKRVDHTLDARKGEGGKKY